MPYLSIDCGCGTTLTLDDAKGVTNDSAIDLVRVFSSLHVDHQKTTHDANTLHRKPLPR